MKDFSLVLTMAPVTLIALESFGSLGSLLIGDIKENHYVTQTSIIYFQANLSKLLLIGKTLNATSAKTQTFFNSCFRTASSNTNGTFFLNKDL